MGGAGQTRAPAITGNSPGYRTTCAAIYPNACSMKYLRRLFASYADYCIYRKGILRYAGFVGAVGYPLFYVIYTRILPQPYENLTIRLIAAVSCLAMATPDYWPASLRKYYFAWSYAVVLYCLPFFHVFMSLKNHGNLVFIADSFMAVFLLVLLTDWRNTVAMLCIGIALGVGLYIATTPQPHFPADYVARLPTFVLVVVGGSLFKFSERQLQDANLRVARALAGSIAHEMRNPLGRVQYSLDMVSRVLPEPSTNPEAQSLSRKQINDLYAHLSQGQVAVERGLQVIAMTLDEVNAKVVDTDRFTLIRAEDAIRKALAEYAYEAERERDIVSLSIIKDFAFRGDETLFVFVLFNLLKNSLYYRSLCPDMRLAVVVDEPRVLVTDTGPGIPAATMPHLFEPFHTSDKVGGTGLGLAYCKRVMAAFDGDITCDSVEGEGTRFTLRFPHVAQTASDEHRRGAARGSIGSLSGKRILIVDDDAMQRRTMRAQLSGLGMVIDEADNGQAGIERMQNACYDLVVMDLRMPVLDGYAATRMIRGGCVPGHQFVPVLACTSDPPHLVRLKVERAGMSGVLYKPFRSADLVRELGSCLERPSADCAILVGKTIILADDDEYGRNIVRVLLETYGVQVLEASHGQAVLDMIAGGQQCDAILLDLHMPGLGGFETTRAIRALCGENRAIPVIALTGYSDAFTMASALSAGMNDVMVKPVRGPALRGKLMQHLGPGTGTLGLKHAVISADGASLDELPAHHAALAVGHEPLLDHDRLQELKEDGSLTELLGDYLEVLDSMMTRLDASVASNNMNDLHEILHSLLGISANIGGAALHRQIRRLYVPLANERIWPEEEEWLPRLRNMIRQTSQTLREQCTAFRP